MSETVVGDLIPVSRASGTFDFEYTVIMNTHATDLYWSKPVGEIDRIESLIELFGSVELKMLDVEVTQMTLLGTTTGTVCGRGNCYVAVIPSRNNIESKIGGNAATILSVPRKRVVALSTAEQMTAIHKINLEGFETDLAQDARRGQAPVMWFGNTGLVKYSSASEAAICSLTWRGQVQCAGASTLW